MTLSRQTLAPRERAPFAALDGEPACAMGAAWPIPHARPHLRGTPGFSRTNTVAALRARRTAEKPTPIEVKFDAATSILRRNQTPLGHPDPSRLDPFGREHDRARAVRGELVLPAAGARSPARPP